MGWYPIAITNYCAMPPQNYQKWWKLVNFNQSDLNGMFCYSNGSSLQKQSRTEPFVELSAYFTETYLKVILIHTASQLGTTFS